MLSRAQQKFITSLALKKNREKERLFIIEGTKPIQDFLQSNLILDSLYATGDYFNQAYNQITEMELARISQLKTPQKALALFKKPDPDQLYTEGLTLVLDAVRDPGNLGTIIRLCDWFGVVQIVCSPDTVDCYNPKVVQSTMGSLARVRVHYIGLRSFLKASQLPKFATTLNGSDIYAEDLPADAVLIMGNEAHGISEAILNEADRKLFIPRYVAQSSVESLNVAMATSICLNEFRRPLLKGKI